MFSARNGHFLDRVKINENTSQRKNAKKQVFRILLFKF